MSLLRFLLEGVLLSDASFALSSLEIPQSLVCLVTIFPNHTVDEDDTGAVGMVPRALEFGGDIQAAANRGPIAATATPIRSRFSLLCRFIYPLDHHRILRGARNSS